MRMTDGRMALNAMFMGTFIRVAAMAYKSGMLEGHLLARSLCLGE
jgi:hypothetical protein